METSSAGKATSEAVIIEQITNQIHIHMNVKDLQVETNRKLEVMSSRLDVLAAMTANASETKRACEGGSGVGSSTPSWDYQASPTFTSRPEGIPPWNQSQYKYCQPLFDSWRDMRRQIKAGSLRVFTGGLGGLMVEGEYEVWVCAHKDPCALGGDFFFCYVLQEQTQRFVPWDQHYMLHLFQSSTTV